MNRISLIEVENTDNLVCYLRDYYEKETGKRLERIDVCNLTDFIEFYGGSIEYAELDGRIKSVVVKENDNKFKIVLSNQLNFETNKKNWNEDYLDIIAIATKRDNLDLVNHANEKLEKGPSRYNLNMELIKAFGNYIFSLKECKLNNGDAIPTFYEGVRCNSTEDQINNSIQTAKRLALTKK